MSSRDSILNAIRSHNLSPTELPSLDQSWITYEDPIEQFIEALQAVGGRGVRVKSLVDVQEELDKVEAFRESDVRCSTVDGVGTPTLDPDSVENPSDLEHVDFAVLTGHFGVAENGAVWTTEESLRHRSLFYITQHLALVVPSSKIVHNMHQAYERISFAEAGFGAFISGPSKTADIEQSLVIGAHGPRSHVVFLVDDSTNAP